MPRPRFMTRGRGFALAVLALNGLMQSGAGVLLALSGSQLVSLPQVAGIPWLPVSAVTISSLLLVGLRILQRRDAEGLALGYVAELRKALLAQVLAAPKASTALRYGMVMTQLLNDLAAVKLWLAYGLVSLLVSVAVIVPALLYLLVWFPTIGTGLAAGILLWTGIVMVTVMPLRRAIRDARRQRGKLAAFAGSALASRLALQHFGRSGRTLRAVERYSKRLTAALVSRATRSGLLRSAGELLYPAMVIGVVMLTSAHSVARLDAPAAAIGFALTGLIVQQLNTVAVAADYWLAFREAMRRITATLSAPMQAQNGMRPLEGLRSQGRSIRVEAVRPVSDAGLSSFTLKVAPGELVWLREQDAKRRSHLLEAIAGLTPLDAGDIKIDEISIKHADPRDWRRAVTLISPVIPLIRGRLDDNIGLGAPSTVGDDEMKEVKVLLGLVDWGQRFDDSQVPDLIRDARIRAARALLRKAGVVLIDDPVILDCADILDPLLAWLGRAGATVIINPRS